eukprot:scaffold10570_cov176-Amphora_coffeaeformis.AAC.50
MESCRPLIVSKDEWEVKFHMHETLNVGDKGHPTLKEKIRELPSVPWLVLKKSGIDGAGHGCFADKDFRKGAIVGLYMGGDVGDPKYSITPGWPAAKDVTCFPFTNPMALEGRSTKTMGLQMMNDPSFGLGDGEVPQVEVNVEVYSDLFAVALKDIKKGEEMFMLYRLEDRKRKAEDENNDGDRKKKAKGESDEECDGKRLLV